MRRIYYFIYLVQYLLPQDHRFSYHPLLHWLSEVLLNSGHSLIRWFSYEKNVQFLDSCTFFRILAHCVHYLHGIRLSKGLFSSSLYVSFIHRVILHHIHSEKYITQLIFLSRTGTYAREESPGSQRGVWQKDMLIFDFWKKKLPP